MFTGVEGGRARTLTFEALALVVLAILVWRWTAGRTGNGARRSAVGLPVPVAGLVVGLAAFVLGGVAVLNLAELAAHQRNELPRDIAFLAPVQQAGSALTVEVSNVPDKFSVLDFAG